MDINKQRMIVTPILRLVFSLTSLVDTSEFFEVSWYSLLSLKCVHFLLVMKGIYSYSSFESGLTAEFNKVFTSLMFLHYISRYEDEGMTLNMRKNSQRVKVAHTGHVSIFGS